MEGPEFESSEFWLFILASIIPVPGLYLRIDASVCMSVWNKTYIISSKVFLQQVQSAEKWTPKMRASQQVPIKLGANRLKSASASHDL